MDRNEAKELHTLIQQAVRDALAATDYELGKTSMRFDPDDNGGGKVTLQFTKVGEDVNGVNAATPEARAFIELAEAGLLTTVSGQPLSPDALGREVYYNGQAYVFAGYKTRAPKRPFVFKAKGGDGRGLVSPQTSGLVNELV